MVQQQIPKLLTHETEAYQQGYRQIAGVDEAGRGPLAGPVVAAACIIPEGRVLEGVNDSKKLTPKMRENLFAIHTQDPSIIYGVGVVSHEEIDEINIFQATIKAMLQAVQNLSAEPDYLLVDGLQLPHPEIPALKLIKGDSRSQSIALASIIAKVTRDQLMLKYHEQWPEYQFDKHKGYGTKIHRDALQRHGRSPIHRRSFRVPGE